ncbi:MAG: MFS transporter [Deltaproteobacteria bacterium]|nr:MFS transporter [Deltaproteobacteria bacterium]
MVRKKSSFLYSIKNVLARDFVFAFLGLFTFTLGFHALFPTLPIYLTSLGFSLEEIGVLVGIMGASSLFSRLIAGGILREYSEKSVMMTGALLFTLTFLAFILFRAFWPLFAVRLFQGVSFAFFDTAALAFIVSVAAPAYRGQTIGYFVLAATFTMAIGPLGGMFLINQYGFTPLFLTCMCLSLFSFFFAWKLRGREAIQHDASTPAYGPLFLNRKIIVPSITSFLKSFVYGAIVAFFPLYALECGVKNPGYFFTATASMLIIGRVLGGRIVDTYNKENIILTCLLTAMVAMMMLSFSTTLPMFIFVGMIWGAGSTFFFPASMAYALEYAGSSDGTAVGTFRSISDLGSALGPVIMGIIIPLTGYRVMFLCLALICLINLGHFQFYVRRRVYRVRL